MKKLLRHSIPALVVFSLIWPVSSALSQGTAFTYQGQLRNNGIAANGTYDFEFWLYTTNTSGTPVAGPVTNSSVVVSNGLFTVTLDFGNGPWTGATNWLQIAVETNSAIKFTLLSPRQQLTPVPYAVYAENSVNVVGTVSGSAVTSVGNSNGGDLNFFIGPAGNSGTSGYQNTADGALALQHLASGANNTALGFSSLYLNTAGSYNVAVGSYSLFLNTNGGNNVAVGDQALYMTTGSGNIGIGSQGGYGITTGSGNIDIGNRGAAGDNNIIRIGTPGTQTATFIAGNVGIGADNPVAQLEVASGGNLSSPQLQLDQTSSGDFARLRMTSGASGGVWDIAAGGSGSHVLNFFVSPTAGSSGTNVLSLNASGNASFSGTVTANGVLLTSDCNAKHNFSALDSQSVLARVASLPITQWQYKNEPRDTKHIGPMAQDFHAAFGLNGDDDKHISTVDEGGVALAAIQGLNQKLEERSRRLERENAELKRSNDSLGKRLADLETVVKQLAAKN